MKLSTILLLIFIAHSLHSQSCNYDSIFVYSFTNILPEYVDAINLEEHTPQSVDIFEEGKKIKTISNNQNSKLKEIFRYYYDKKNRLIRQVDSSWVDGTEDINVDSTIYSYDKDQLIEKTEYRSYSTFLPKVSQRYEYRNDTIFEIKNYRRNVDLQSKKYFPQNDSISMEIICNIHKNGYTLQKFDSNDEMFQIYSCGSDNNCRLKQNRFNEYDECNRLKSKSQKWVSSNRYFVHYIYVYK